jgi:hypothetical protein
VVGARCGGEYGGADVGTPLLLLSDGPAVLALTNRAPRLDESRARSRPLAALLLTPRSSSDAEDAAREKEDHSDPLLDGSCFIGGACISFPSASALQRADCRSEADEGVLATMSRRC